MISQPMKHISMMNLSEIKRVVDIVDEETTGRFALVCRTNQVTKKNDLDITSILIVKDVYLMQPFHTPQYLLSKCHWRLSPYYRAKVRPIDLCRTPLHVKIAAGNCCFQCPPVEFYAFCSVLHM